MPLIPTAYTTLLTANLTTKGIIGTSAPALATAIGNGVINTTIGLTGKIATGVLLGPSTGVGIIISGTNISANIKARAILLFGQEGSKLQDFCDAVGSTTQTIFALATLVSTTNGAASFPNFLNVASISAMGLAIKNAAPFTGSQWKNFATAIAYGICQEIGNNGIGVLTGATLPGTLTDAPVIIS